MLRFLTIFFFLSVPVFGESRSLSCDVSAPIALLMDADTGKILFSKGADLPRAPASATKIATALYVLHKGKLSLDDVIIPSADAIAIVSPSERRKAGKHPSYRLEFGGTHIGIKQGEELDVLTLFYGLMLSSGNDAANVLAEATSGSVSCFMEELNAFLAEIGCLHTNLQNPHGMPDPLQITTARDLALIARHAMKYPIFKKIVSTAQYERPKTNKQDSFLLRQSNELLKPGKYFYPYATGVKTGFTNNAGFVLVSSATKGDRNLIAVVMQCDEKAKRYRSTTALFEAAFNEPKAIRKLLSKQHDIFSTSIEGAQKDLKGELEEDLILEFYPSLEDVYTPHMHWDFLTLPIQKGDKVGEIEVLNESNLVVKTASVYAKEEVLPTWRYIGKKHLQSFCLYVKARKVFGGYLFAFVLFAIPFLRFIPIKRRSKPNKVL